MKLVEFANAKGGIVWVNAAQVLWAAPPEGASSSMYGDRDRKSVV